MRRTHKFKQMREADIQAAVRGAKSLAAAARQLDIAVSTLHRWIREGRVQRPSRRLSTPMAMATTRTPTAWRRWVRGRYDLDGNEAVLVDLAADALILVKYEGIRPETKLAAMARFAAIVRQLDFEEETDGEVEREAQPAPSVKAWPRRVG